MGLGGAVMHRAPHPSAATLVWRGVHPSLISEGLTSLLDLTTAHPWLAGPSILVPPLWLASAVVGGE